MNKLALILVIIFAFPHTCNAQRKRAFMVGISNYHSNGYKVWHNIHGAEDVALLTSELRKKGFTIQSLTNEKATYQGILNSLNEFIKRSKKGDIVYLHFSCHGQPVEDGMFGDPKDEIDHWDESLVPIDAGKTFNPKGYKGDKHITDDNLNIFFNRLRKRIGSTGMLYVAMDACHAGGGSMGGLETIRGTNDGLTKSGLKYDPPKHNILHYALEKGKDMAAALFFEACKSYQINSEIMVSGKEYGALSYNIYQALKGMKSFDKKSKEEFKASVEKGRWPRTQELVIESSF